MELRFRALQGPLVLLNQWYQTFRIENTTPTEWDSVKTVGRKETTVFRVGFLKPP